MFTSSATNGTKWRSRRSIIIKEFFLRRKLRLRVNPLSLEEFGLPEVSGVANSSVKSVEEWYAHGISGESFTGRKRTEFRAVSAIKIDEFF
jgi:hypothetical protein